MSLDVLASIVLHTAVSQLLSLLFDISWDHVIRQALIS